MLAESTAVIAVPNEFTRTQLEGRLRTRLEDALSDSLNRPIRIAVSVDDTLAPADALAASTVGGTELVEQPQQHEQPAFGEATSPISQAPNINTSLSNQSALSTNMGSTSL